MTFLNIILAAIPVFLIVTIGFFAHKFRVVDDATESSLLRLVMTVLYPCFILSKVPGNEALQSSAVVVAALLIGAGLVSIGFAVCYFAGKLIGIRPNEGLNTFAVATGLQNYSFLPIPLIEALLPETADEVLGVLFVHSLGVDSALWTLGIILLSGSATGAWRRLINGPSIAIVLGLALNFSGAWRYLPEVFTVTTRMLGNCAIPVSLLLVGSTLAGVLERESWRPDWRVLAAAPVLRFGILPVLFFLTAWLVSFSPELQQVLIFQGAMPTAIFPIVLSRHFGGHPAIAVQVALITAALSLVMIPVLLSVGMLVVAPN